MKKISVKSHNKRKDNSISGEAILDGSDGGKQVGDHGKASPTVRLGNVGVKVESERRVADSGEMLDTVEEVVEAPWEEMSGPDLSQGYVVDLTQQFNRIFVQTTFNSFKEFEKLFNKFKAETGSVFRIKSSCSIAYENSRRKRHFIPSRFKFVSVRYCCVHYGHPKIAGQGIRRKQRYLPCGCEAMLSVSYNCGALVISQANMRHNHDVSCEMAPFYAINRRITNSELKDVADVVQMMSNSRSLQHFLQVQFHRATTLQDAKNIRSRVKAMKFPQTNSTRSPGSEEEEEEEEIDEDTILDNTDEGVSFRLQEEVARKNETSKCEYWGEDTISKASKRQEPQQQQEGKEMIAEDQEPELDPGIRKDVLDEIRTRLFGAMQNCNARVFKERVSVIEKLIEGWENNDPVHIQYMEESDFKARTLSVNKDLSLETVQNQNDINANSCMSGDILNVAVPVMRRIIDSQLYPAPANNKLLMMENENQSRVTSIKVNENPSIIRYNSRNENSNQHYITDKPCSMNTDNSKNNGKRPIILSIVKGFIGGGDQAVEVEIEVDGEVAIVKGVKREPLDYYEVNVAD